MIQTNDIITGGIVLSVVGATLVYLRSIPSLIINRIKRRLLFTVRVYQTDTLFDMLDDWFIKHYPAECKDVEAIYSPPCTPSLSSDNEDSLIYRQEDSFFIIRYLGKRLVVRKTKEKMDHANDVRNVFLRHYRIVGWMAKKQISALMNEVVKEYESSKKTGRVNIYYSDDDGTFLSTQSSRAKPIDKVILPTSVREKLLSDINLFRDSREWYYQNNLTYKRGYMLYGPPGTGKTTLCLSIASYLQKDLLVINLNTINSDARLTKMFANIRSNNVTVIEDIDASFDGRKSKGKITFAGLLNAIDGVVQKEDFILIITTNHPEKLDPALIRPGRIDVQIEIPNPGPVEVSEYLTGFYSTPIRISSCQPNLSMAKIQEICVRNRYDQAAAIREISDMITEMKIA